jgi:glucan 1,3-beta-glucosidase
MHYSSVIAYLSLLAGANAQLLEIPAVDNLVSSAMRSFEQYTSLGDPTRVATAVASLKTNTAKVAKVNAGVAAADTAYWLADIAHQGIAAFNSNPSGYKVFRNVKDYGAKGKHARAP